ncbi:MAG: CHC2 zinc finger domain-containing protein [Pseudonocardiaceae bacterium]
MRYFSDDLLRRLRNEIDFAGLFSCLNWPHKRRADQLAFLCPRCRETDSAINPRTNLARCFHCKTNFNPIDFTMKARKCDFVEAVEYLTPFLPAADPTLLD